MSTIEDVVADLFDVRIPLDEAMDRHFTRDVRQCIDGRWDDRAAVHVRFAAMRLEVVDVAITVLDELAQEDRYAERHVIDLSLRDGRRIVREVCVFARRHVDGRFMMVEEMTRHAEVDEGR